jgi:uncharacterized repeat protein (TIGR01451 family)
VHVHIVSTTSKASCGTVDNTATVSTTNDGSGQDEASVVVNCGDISISKVADAATVSAGDQIGFTITLTNSGTGIARGVTANDTLPTDPGTSWSIDAANSDSGWSIAAGALGYGPQDLAPGASVHVHIVSTTSKASCGTVDNTATVSTTNDGSDEASASVGVDCPDIKIVKTADAGTINAGDTAAFTIVVSNIGGGVAHNVTVNDPLPAGVSWSEDSADCSIASGVLSCSFGDLAAQASRTVHITGPTAPANCGTLANTASVAAANEAEADTDNNSDSASIVVECPNVALTKTADAASVKAGQQLGFRLRVANSGDGTAKGVGITDHLPTNGGLAFSIDAAASDAGCAIHSGTLSCSFGDLAHAQSKSVHLVSPTTEATCGKVDNSAVAASLNGSAVQASASVTVACPIIDLAITKVDDPDPVLINGTLTYTLGVRNNGPDTATAVVVTDSLPANVTFVSATPSTGTCSGDRVITCQLGTLAAGGTATIQVVVKPTATGTITNTAVVAGHETESDLSNNTASADTRVNGARLTPPVCYTLKVRPGILRVGHRTRVQVVVRAGGKVAAGIRVSLRGSGIAKIARTNAHGVARLTVKPKRAGIIRVTAVNRRSCTTPQIGVAGVFKPPHFTG